jgi:ubiquinone/menaquinone biosynthesis C-methylase UbiE
LKSPKERIYDRIYGENTILYDAPRGIIGFLYKKFQKYELNRNQAVLNLLPSFADKLLDIGCGNGDFVFSARSKFAQCYGVDISPKRILNARTVSKEMGLTNQLNFESCDIDNGLPFSDAYFDVITCVSVLEHVFNPPNTIEEIYRILKPGGLFILQVPNIAWLPLRFQLLFGSLPLTGGVYSNADWEHLHNFTKSLLYQLLQEKGFTISNIFCSGVFARYRKWWISALGSDLIVRSTKGKKAKISKKPL